MSEYKVVSNIILYPETYEFGKHIRIRDTYVNLKWLLEHYKTNIRYNNMSRRREISIPNQFIFEGDKDNSSLQRIEYLATVNDMPARNIDKHLDVIAWENQYHPIAESISNKPWDNQPRLDRFIEALRFKTNQEVSRKIVKTWMTAAIAAIYTPGGFINQGVLVLQGEQKIGKTSWVKSLDPINCGAVKESAFLDPTNKDSVALLASYWIAELGELDSIFKKSEIGRLKSFITTQFDDVRHPYARKSTRLERRSAYIATVNDSNFLVDDTGNRRWWTVELESIDFNHGLDIQQMWAEVYHYWQQGAPTDLDQELQSKVNENNKAHERTDPLREKLLDCYNWEMIPDRWMSTTKIMEELGIHRPNRAEATHFGKLLSDVVCTKSRISRGLKQYLMPVMKSNFYS